ncbi:MAG: hypothetical protein JWM16_5480 [Verrucomicrobiales bacterium]|nr:hypothetical protein [Verrucomicrobiales bacterium]
MSDKQSRNPLSRLASGIRDAHSRHQARHRPTGFGFAFADQIDYLDPAKWDAVVQRTCFFLQRHILRVIENHGPENIDLRYALIFQEDKPVAALAVQIVSFSGDRLGKQSPPSNSPKPEDRFAGLVRRTVAPVAKTAISRLRERILVAGNLISWGFHGIAFAQDVDHSKVWPGIAEALYRIRRAERLIGQTDFVMVKDLTDAQSGLDALRRFSYRPLETEPNMVLAIDPSWASYEDYLAALDAKYRRNAKDQAKKLAGSGCVLESITNLHIHGARLHELYLEVHDNASIRLVTLPDTCLPALAEAAGDDFRCTIVRRGETILGFVTVLRDGDTAIAWYIGFDRSAASEGLPIYLQLLHATIGHAIAWRCKRLSLGRTALEPKAALGARPEPMSVWIRHRVPAMNWLLRSLLEVVPHAEPPERNPFKSRKDPSG